MKNVELYEQVLAKHEWAKKHLDNLDSALVAFGNASRDIIGRHENVEAGQVTYYVRRVPAPPPEISLIAGDIIHSLRCALDYTFCGMIMFSGKTPGSNTKFPIYETSEAYHAALPAKVEGFSRFAVDALNRLKPYRGGNNTLWTIHHLNNIDKHRLMLTMCLTSAGRTLTPSEGKKIAPAMIGRTRSGLKYTLSKTNAVPLPLYLGRELLTVSASEAEEDIGFIIVVATNEPGVSEGTPLSLLLHLMRNELWHTVNDLAKFI